jgi:hypothetical protein
MLSTGADLRYPTTTGAQVRAMNRVLYRYLDRVVAAATQDPAVAETYARVIGMLARPAALFAPRILAAALRARPHDDAAALPPPHPASATNSVRHEARLAAPSQR